VWTLGVGHTKAAGNPDPATFQGELMLGEAIGLFRHDVMRYEAQVAKAVTVPLKQHEFDALVSFHYNTGAIGKASFVKKLNAGDRAGAIKGIMDWRKPAEIIPRRTAERDLFRDGKCPAPYANLYPATKAGKVERGKGRRVDLRTIMDPSPGPALSTPKPQPDTGIPASTGGRTLLQINIDLIAKLFGRK
jgi:lysozyme